MNTDSLRELINDGMIRISIVGVLAILALFLLVQTIGAAGHLGRSGVPATETITVQATGEATVAPDVARVSFTVQNNAATVAAAQDATTKQSNEAIDFVKEQGIEEKDIRTLYYNINPEYSYPNPCRDGMVCPAYTGNPRITGYQVSQTIEVTLRDLNKVGEMLTGLGKVGVQNLSGPSFALDEESAGYNAARADAIEKASEQAQTLAKQLGVRLGKVVSFSESSGYQPYPMAYGMGGAMESKAVSVTPQVPTGENSYSASVSITYEIR